MPQAPQAVLDLPDDPAARVAALVRVVAHRAVDLRREHDVVAPAAGERLADDLLRLAARVDVGGVDEVDAGVERAMDDPDASSWSGFPQLPNIIAPRHSGLTRTPVLPSVRVSMLGTLPTLSGSGSRSDYQLVVLETHSYSSDRRISGSLWDYHGRQPVHLLPPPRRPRTSSTATSEELLRNVARRPLRAALRAPQVREDQPAAAGAARRREGRR